MNKRYIIAFLKLFILLVLLTLSAPIFSTFNYIHSIEPKKTYPIEVSLFFTPSSPVSIPIISLDSRRFEWTVEIYVNIDSPIENIELIDGWIQIGDDKFQFDSKEIDFHKRLIDQKFVRANISTFCPIWNPRWPPCWGVLNRARMLEKLNNADGYSYVITFRQFFGERITRNTFNIFNERHHNSSAFFEYKISTNDNEIPKSTYFDFVMKTEFSGLSIDSILTYIIIPVIIPDELINKIFLFFHTTWNTLRRNSLFTRLSLQSTTHTDYFLSPI